jgi:hypothetical protein
LPAVQRQRGQRAIRYLAHNKRTLRPLFFVEAHHI